MRKASIAFFLTCLAIFGSGQATFKLDSSRLQNFGPKPDTAYVYTFIDRLSDIDFSASTYRLGIWFLITCKNPTFNFEKQLEVVGAKDQKIVSISRGKYHGLPAEKFKASFVVEKNWDTKAYPFDEQILDIKLYNAVYNIQHLVLKNDKPEMHNDTTLKMENGWELRSDTIQEINEFAPLDEGKPHSFLQYTIKIHRSSAVWIFFKLFIGMYVSFFVAFFAFFIEVRHVEPRFGLPVGALFAAIANKYIVESALPQSPAFTIVDGLHSITFFFIMLIIALSVKSLNNYEKRKLSEPKKDTIFRFEIRDKKIGIAVIICYVVLNVACLLWAFIR
jgi:hypothetical protein